MKLREILESQGFGGSDSCLKSTPEENKKKFKTYANYRTAATKALGKELKNMNKDDWKAIDRGWKSKDES